MRTRRWEEPLQARRRPIFDDETMRFATGVAALATVLAACASGSDLPAAETTTTTAAATPTTENDTTTMPISEQEELPIVTPAQADLARRLGVEPDDLEVISAEEVTWPDGSLGCPEPGMSYTQALVEGSKVVLGHDDRVYVYHAGDDGEPFLCPSTTRRAATRWFPLRASTVRRAVLVVVVAFPVGCASTETGEATTATVLTTTGPENPAPPKTSTLSTVGTEGETPFELDSVMEAALADLGPGGIDPSAVEVLVSERVIGPDGRIGCPEPVRPYTMDRSRGSGSCWGTRAVPITTTPAAMPFRPYASRSRQGRRSRSPRAIDSTTHQMKRAPGFPDAPFVSKSVSTS